ncbi:hypothetical protein MPSEU_000219700 [Mayamaea pseudoterrestris]|nr:hypothetical protein MPSEU_000219700 [Mayamaea pseudoterrestris]
MSSPSTSHSRLQQPPPTTTSTSRPLYPMLVSHQFIPGGCIVKPDAAPYSLHQVNVAVLKQAYEADVKLWKYNADNNLRVLPSLSVLAESVFSRLAGCHPSYAKEWADAMIAQYSGSGNDATLMGDAATLKRSGGSKKKSSTVTLLQADATKINLKTRNPCGYVFQRGDIAWNCRTCQTDPTCVICDACFRESNHNGHEVYFHRTTPGGCCDCGDVEAWAKSGCCDLHRPEEGNDEATEASQNDPMEAVAMCAKGYKQGELAVSKCGLEPMVLAALGVVIGAAVHAIVESFDGAAVGADATQWRLKWAEEAARIANGQAFADGGFDASRSVVTPVHYLQESENTTVLPLPEGYHLQLRLHNDDVHTYEEVIAALHETRPGRRTVGAGSVGEQSLVTARERAQDMTQHVDSDGQVTVKTYSRIPAAMQGFRRLKSRGLHGAVVSVSQVQLEMRAKNLTVWLQEVAAAHPAAAALTVHALVQVDPEHDLAGVHVWRQARMMPLWAGVENILSEEEILSKRFDAFPPHLLSSYVTREESELLHGIAMSTQPEQFVLLTRAPNCFYSNVGWRLPSDRYKKSPHALWGTVPSSYTATASPELKHPLLQRLETGMMDSFVKNELSETIYVIDTDFRKQAEADQLTSSVFPHRLPGLHMVSGIGTSKVHELDEVRPPLPSPMDLRHLLANSSFRVPMSPILMLLLTDPYPTKAARATLHALLLSLLTDSRFRCRFAGAIGVAYRPLSTLFCAGVGTESDTPLHFTVQIFTAASLVRALGYLPAAEKLLLSDKLQEEDVPGASIGVFMSPIAHTITRCIHTNLLGATKEVSMIMKNTSGANDDDSLDDGLAMRNDRLFPSLTYVAGEHPLLTLLPAASDDGFLDSRSTRHKRLPHLLRDLEYVIETTGTAIRLLLPNKFPVYHGPLSTSARDDFLSFAAVYVRMLRLAQGMDPQKRKISGGHVEYEQSRWLEAFGLSLNFAGTRDAIAESSISTSTASLLGHPLDDGTYLPVIREATGNFIAAIIREIKQWLYQEGVLESGFPLSPAHGGHDIVQAETLQRSTLHVTCSQFISQASNNTPNAVALACATGIKMTENQLTLIENALRAEAAEREHVMRSTKGPGASKVASPVPAMIDWLRVPHSPLGGDSLSFHLPLHRALAKCIKSALGLAIPTSTRTTSSGSWWKIPVLDAENLADSSTSQQHPLVPLIGKIMRYQNCRVTWSSGPECSAQEAQRRKSRSRTVSANIAVTKIIHSLADHPLRCIAAAQQIERHLWARNGSSVAGMAMNYTSTPLCRSFRDLDMLLVQLSAAGMSCGLGARRTFALMLSRFNMDGFLCDPERRIQTLSTSGVSMPNGYVWVQPPRLGDPEQALVLSESFFATVCVVVSELPPPPPASVDDDVPLKQTIRRELLHALAAEPRSHSEALSAASASISRREESEGSVSRVRDVFSEVLREIAKQKTPSSSRAASGPPSYELKPDVCDEYDPTFFHLHRNEHQHAMDIVARLRKQKVGVDKDFVDATCLPLVCPPPKAHPRFLPCRLVLHLTSIDAALRRFLLFALTGGSWLPPHEPVPFDEVADEPVIPVIVETSSTHGTQISEEIPSTSIARRVLQSPSSSSLGRRSSADTAPFTAETVASSSVSFLEILQLLTLQIHTLEECASLHMLLPDLDEESKMLSASLSINSYLNRLVQVPDSLKDVWALKPYPEGPLSSSGSGEKRGSILGLLVALYEHRTDHAAVLDSDDGDFAKTDADDHGGARSLSSSGLKWLLRFVHSLVNGAPSVNLAVKSATTGIPFRSQAGFQSARPFASESSVSSWTIDGEVRSTINGMFSELPDLWPKKRELAMSPSDAASTKAKEARITAQQRVMAKMKKQQAAFAATIAPSLNVAEADVTENEADLCIICRCDDADGENNGPLGYLGHVQRSRVTQLRATSESSESQGSKRLVYRSFRVVGHMGCQLRENESIDSKPIACLPKGSVVTVLKDKVNDAYGVLSRRVLVRHVKKDPASLTEIHTEGWASVQSSFGYVILSPLASICYMNTTWGSTRPIVKQCGHAAHLTCVETHMLSLHQRSAADQPYDGRFAANIREGEFLCPLCKQLSNVLIPRDNFDAVGDVTVSKPDIECSSLPQARPIRALLTGKRMSELTSDNFQGLTRDALSKFGIHLYNAMSAVSDNGRNKRNKQQQHWNKAIRKWDYEEETLEDHEADEETNECNIGGILRLLRQQLIAWSAFGYGASAAESATRSVEEKLPFGVVSLTNEPWPGFNAESKDSHPMLLEAMRTLTAASRHLDVLCLEMKETFVHATHSDDRVWVIGALLADIIDGRSWFSSNGVENCSSGGNATSALWSELTAQVASMPCHVARDGALLQRCEARATASEMWTVKGIGTESNRKDEPPTPLAVNQLLMLGLPHVQRDWGSTNPYVSQVRDDFAAPFRPGIAAAFLYKPLLIWDLHSLAGAIFSSVLANNLYDLPSSGDLCNIAQILLLARLIQAISTPFDICLSLEAEDDEESCWSVTEQMSEGTALTTLVTYCRSMITKKSLQPLDEMLIDGSIEASPTQLLSTVGDAILPFARSLVLMLRATSAVIRQRGLKDAKRSTVVSPDDDRLLSCILDNEFMSQEDGFYLLKILGGPYPSALINSQGPWKSLIDDWLMSAVGFELHHGSMGKSCLLVGNTMKHTSRLQHTRKYDSSEDDMEGSTSQIEMEVDEDTDRMNESTGSAYLNRHHMLMDDDVDESDEELSEVDGPEEVVDLGGQMVGGPIFQASSNNVSSLDSVGSEDFSSSGSEGEVDTDREFAHVSRAPILPYQPSTYAIEGIGPGRQGTLLECESANAVMADLSHLGLIHRRFTPTFSFIRLPTSFVELYNMVSKVKGRDDAPIDIHDEVSNSETAMCLLTGSVMRSGASRRQGVRSHRTPGACTLHARKHGSGIGLFFLVQKCTVLLIHNNKSAYCPSIYVDEHGEEDPGLRRGRPLFLNATRLQALEKMWRQHGIPREVAQIRSTSDRVIRDNWY